MTTRVRCRKDAAATSAPSSSVARFDTDVAGDFDGLPYVLTAEAVRAGEIPALGKSALPPSLEAHVPAGFRFWKADTIEQARATRDALVDTGLFRAEDVMKVDGVLRFVVRRAFLATVHEDKADVPLVQRESALVQAASCLKIAPGSELVAFEGTVADVASYSEVTAPWLMRLEESEGVTKAVLGALSKAVFKLATRDGVFVSNVELDRDAAHVIPVDAQLTKRNIRLLKADDVPSTEERFTLGIVLEPDVVDSQMDTYDAATIRAAAHGYMEHFGELGLQHQEKVTGRLKVLESYIAPVDMQIGEVLVKAGTWLMGIRFVDDDLWAAVKDGSLTGLSIGGSALRQPVEGDPPPALA